MINPKPTGMNKPIVIAHRGASAYVPEHTLESYRLAIEQGADFIEPDLVLTRDGVLLARHENELGGTTDVAEHSQFTDRKTTKKVDGRTVKGWFSEDFTLAEIKQLRARERIPEIRPDNIRYDGQYHIPTFKEVLILLSDYERRTGKQIGVYPETKHPTYFEHEGCYLDGEAIGQSISLKLVSELKAQEFIDPCRVFIQSFEVGNLIQLANEIMPKAGIKLPLIQLLGDLQGTLQNADTTPYDLIFHHQRPRTGIGAYEVLEKQIGVSSQGFKYVDLLKPKGIKFMFEHYASGLGPAKDSLLQSTGQLPSWASLALEIGLGIHPYTLRKETIFLSPNTDHDPNGMEYEMKRLLDMGVTGFFTDFPDVGVAVIERWLSKT